MVSPALVGVAMGPGTHVVTFQYAGFGYYGQLVAVALAALVAAALLDRRSARQPGNVSSGRDLEIV
jgi:hypothetical protein